MRAGGQTLTLLGTPRNVLILESLAAGSKGQFELRRDAGALAQSTLRRHLGNLETAGVVIRNRLNSFPGTLNYALTEAGRELLLVVDSVERWLDRAQQGPLELATDAGKAAVKGLIDGWLTKILDPLASEPLSLTQLDTKVTSVSYPTLERRLEAMRLADQLDEGSRNGKGTPLTISNWLRVGIGPLLFAAAWEDRHTQKDADPWGRAEVESAFKIASPLLRLRPEHNGVYKVSLASKDGDRRRSESALVSIQDGDVAYCDGESKPQPDVCVSGSRAEWFSTATDPDSLGLKIDGDPSLVHGIVKRIHEALLMNSSKPVAPQGARGAVRQKEVYSAIPK